MTKLEGNVAKALVLDTFKPKVAVVCSPAAQNVCEKNGLQFTQLIQPFCTLSTDLSWQEPNGQYISPKGLRLHPVDLSSWKPPEYDHLRNRRILNNLVSQSIPPLCLSGENCQDMTVMHLHGRSTPYSVVIPNATPWYDNWREIFLKFYAEQQISQHDFTSQFLSCVLVIAASEARTQEDLGNIVSKLSKLQFQHQNEWPQAWFLQSVLKFYVIIHDNSSDDLTSSEKSYQMLRTTYGGNFCHMLKLNSREVDGENDSVSDVWTPFIQKEKRYRKDVDCEAVRGGSEEEEPAVSVEMLHPLSPTSEYPPRLPADGKSTNGSITNASKPLGYRLTESDKQNIQVAINDFIGKALLPYAERQAKVLNESIVNRRGMSKSILSATKRLFGTGAKAQSSLAYTLESPEMLTRKLADLYFLLGHYEGAYQLFHQIKKDFQADSAWVYYASSLEMAALSHFMMTQAEPPAAITRSFPLHYINEAITYFLDHCRMPEAAIRCAIIFCECLKQINNFPDAAAIFIRMTKEDCDVRSALMLEQAAYTFVKLNSPRKYALHCVLAGHRYAKAGLRMHSISCYAQAYNVYGGKGWKIAEDHVQFTIARHQFFLSIYTDLMKRLLSLFKQPFKQSVQQMQLYYKEFLAMSARIFEDSQRAEEIHLPIIICSKIRVTIAVTGLPTGEVTDVPTIDEVKKSSWDALEEQVVKDCFDTAVLLFRPSRLWFDHTTDNTVNPIVPKNETFYVDIPFYNPLLIELILRSLTLEFDSECVEAHTYEEGIVLRPGETKIVRFAVSCKSEGLICYERVSYELELGSTRVPFVQTLKLKGPRLNATAADRWSKTYAKDLRNKIKIISSMPLLQAQLSNVPSSFHHSQKVSFNLSLRDASINSGLRERIHKLVIASPFNNEALSVESSKTYDSDGIKVTSVTKRYTLLTVEADLKSQVEIPCIFTVPEEGESIALSIMILYAVKTENDVSSSGLARLERSYRTIKISSAIPLQPSVAIRYSWLKNVNVFTHLGLLSLQNLSKTRRLTVQSLNVDSESAILESITSGTSSERVDDAVVSLGPLQSSNLVLRTASTTSCLKEGNFPTKDQVNMVFLSVTWKLVDTDNSRYGGEQEATVSGMNKVLLKEAASFETHRNPSVVFQLRHKAVNSHDFTQSPCYICPVELIVSCHKSGKLQLKIKKSETAEETRNPQMVPSHGVYMVGKTSWYLDVKSFATEKLVFNVAFVRPGVYNVGPSIHVQYLDDGVGQNYELNSPLILNQVKV